MQHAPAQADLVADAASHCTLAGYIRQAIASAAFGGVPPETRWRDRLGGEHPLELPGTVGPAGPGGVLAVRVQIARMAPPLTGIIAPVMKDAAGESRNAATRPNSSGSPYRRSGMR